MDNELVATSNHSSDESTDISKKQYSDSRHQLECDIDQLLSPITGVSLQWKSLRSTSQCRCGASFSYAQRKVTCHIIIIMIM